LDLEKLEGKKKKIRKVTFLPLFGLRKVKREKKKREKMKKKLELL